MILFGQSMPTLAENWVDYFNSNDDFIGKDIRSLDLDSIVKNRDFIYVNTRGPFKSISKRRINCRKKTIQYVAKTPYGQAQNPPYTRVRNGVWSYPSYDPKSDSFTGPPKQTSGAALDPLYQLLCKGKRNF